MITNTYIALLRAINDGGINSLPMKDFMQLLGKMGLRNVKIYIQTDNAVFHAKEADAVELPERIKVKINRSHGFAPEVILFRLDELESAIASNPYPEAESDPKLLHLTFLSSTPITPDMTTLENIRKGSEHFTLKGRVFYFHAPEGVARSKLFSQIERLLGVVGTARNWRTAFKVLEIAQQVAAADAATRRG